MQALLLDFNGTLSNDEPLMCAIFQDIFSEERKPLTEAEYYGQLAGLSDPEVVERWMGEPRPDLVKRKIAEYRREVQTGWTIEMSARFAVEAAAKHVPVAVVSGAAREEIEDVLREARILTHISVIVAAEDVTYGKPNPEGYRRALHAFRLDGEGCVAVEDSDVGVAAAKAAGLYCVAVTSTLPVERLRQADELTKRLDGELIDRLLSSE